MPSIATQTGLFNHQRKFDVSIFLNQETKLLLNRYNELIHIRDQNKVVSLEEPDANIGAIIEQSKAAIRELNDFSMEIYEFLQACQEKETQFRHLSYSHDEARRKLDSVIGRKNAKAQFNVDGLAVLAPLYFLLAAIVLGGLSIAAIVPWIMPLVFIGVTLLFSTPLLISVIPEYIDHRNSVKSAIAEEPAAIATVNELTQKHSKALGELAAMQQPESPIEQSIAATATKIEPEVPKTEPAYRQHTFFDAGTKTQKTVEVRDVSIQTEISVQPSH